MSLIPSGFIQFGESKGDLTPVNYSTRSLIDRSFFNFWLGWDAIKNKNTISRFKKIANVKTRTAKRNY